RSLMNLNHADVWGRWAIILLAGSVLLAVVYLVSTPTLVKRSTFYLSLLMISTSILFLALAYLSHHYSEKRNEAIVIQPSLTVKSAPNDNSTDLFVINEGTKVWITDQIGEWKEVRIANGNRGWSKREAIEII
ncbi:MAG TPA: SH3 domain-containing protein, partial [Bacteroidales bacterium]|nr:SH3 domain-containing protein [Bacteroidales bacterium]